MCSSRRRLAHQPAPDAARAHWSLGCPSIRSALSPAPDAPARAAIGPRPWPASSGSGFGSGSRPGALERRVQPWSEGVPRRPGIGPRHATQCTPVCPRELSGLRAGCLTAGTGGGRCLDSSSLSPFLPVTGGARAEDPHSAQACSSKEEAPASGLALNCLRFSVDIRASLRLGPNAHQPHCFLEET